MSFDSLEGKVGRVYMPKQDLNSMSLNKMKVGHVDVQLQSMPLNTGWYVAPAALRRMAFPVVK